MILIYLVLLLLLRLLRLSGPRRLRLLESFVHLLRPLRGLLRRILVAPGQRLLSLLLPVVDQLQPAA